MMMFDMFYPRPLYSHPGQTTDAAVQTVLLRCGGNDDDEGGGGGDVMEECVEVTLRILVTVVVDGTQGGGIGAASLTVWSDWNETWNVNVPFDNDGRADDDGGGGGDGTVVHVQRDIVVKQPKHVKRWWPHGIRRTNVPTI